MDKKIRIAKKFVKNNTTTVIAAAAGIAGFVAGIVTGKRGKKRK